MTVWITLLTATTGIGFCLSYWLYCNMRQAEKLAREWQGMCETAYAKLASLRNEKAQETAQRQAAGRKGGLATAARRAMEREFDSFELSADEYAELSYPAALDEARRT